MEIRNGTMDDAKGIINVYLQSYNMNHEEEAMAVLKQEFKKEVKFIVAEEKGEVIGLVTWFMKGAAKHQLAELDRIAVIPEFRGKGVAKQLFQVLIQNAKDHYSEKGSRLRKLYLFTHDSNERAKAFYKKLGFTHETTLKNHYYEDTNELVFSMFF